ncbi:hypothetical protein K504DRAFT_462216 [Pleomassaria siparia CBS 279.74]|uniref:Gfd2/YDR514C-like C-terminal domain-containing protein n=1 Tax=Pleomassaria siparia CBS 279.74 TaxID=1314801 RepID=A0A6G1KLK7_9PLEO|nr:hypothetical protein K504DRAFT_462216 [Pleomassaria siparia CBS 279.74]
MSFTAVISPCPVHSYIPLSTVCGSRMNRRTSTKTKKIPTATPATQHPYTKLTDMQVPPRTSRSALPIPVFLKMKNYTQAEIVLHFFGQPIPYAPQALEDALFIGLDVEWYESGSGDITEIGISILDARDLDSKKSIWENIENLQAVHARIKSNAHMLNTKKCPGRPDKFHFGETRFVSMEEAPEALKEAFSHRSERGSLRPVIFVGHAVDNDIEQIKDNFGIDLKELGNIVTTIDSQVLAVEAKIEKEGVLISLKNLLKAHGIEEEFLHTGGNDIVYTMIAIVLTASFLVHRQSHASNQAGVARLKEILPQKPQPSWGIGTFCIRCDATTHSVDDCREMMKCDKCAANPEDSHGAHSHSTHKCLAEAERKSAKPDTRGVVVPCEACVMNIDPTRWKRANTHRTEDCFYAKMA